MRNRFNEMYLNYILYASYSFIFFILDFDRISAYKFRCGLRRSTNATPRIIGGREAALGDFPWQAAIANPAAYFCSGTIISRHWILSAAHCFKGWSYYSDYRIFVMGQFDDKGTVHKIIKQIPHPKFVRGVYHHDLVLYKVDPPIKYTKGDAYGGGAVGPICLVEQNEEVSGTFTVSGWGQTIYKKNPHAHYLMAVDVDILKNDACVDAFNAKTKRFDSSIMICAGSYEGGRDACLGDSGGPLVGIDNQEIVFQVGIVSSGHDCGKAEIPGLYTKLSVFRDWIQEITGV